VVGGEALERADRHTVVAELGVVVVLDDQRVVAARPGDEVAAPASVERRAGRIGVRRGDEHGRDVVAVERGSVEAAPVDRDGHRLEAGHRDRVAVGAEARVLDRDPARAAAAQRAADEREPLGHAGAGQDAARLGGDPAHAPEVRGQRGPQP
jgi:hypothetical protein